MLALRIRGDAGWWSCWEPPRSPSYSSAARGAAEHFGWIDTSDDGLVTEAEWSVARALGLGAWARSP
jgi:hypothetical protein